MTSRVPVHAGTFAGGMKRFLPAVEAPYGMPLNVLTLRLTNPRTLPAAVSTTTNWVSAADAGVSHLLA